MKLFTVGPTQMYEDTLEVASKQLPYFRTNEFSNIVLEITSKMKKILGAKEKDKLVLITGSGSAAMEAVVSNSFDSKDKLLIINGGTFGKRFVSLAQIYNLNYETIDVKYGETLNRNHFINRDLNGFTALLANIDETSTGQLYDIKLLSEISTKNNMKLIIDGISSILADPYNMQKSHIDCTILSSQKALALSPGLSIITMTNEFYEEKVKNKKPINLYLNINEHVKNMERGQTPNTPAVGIILELYERLKHINSQQDEIKKVRERALYFRKLAMESGLQIPTYPLSNALTPIIIPNHEAKKICEYLKDKYNIYVNPTGGDLANDIIRISHLGNLTLNDYNDLIQKIKEVL